jgi:hypothetical protein
MPELELRPPKAGPSAAPARAGRLGMTTCENADITKGRKQGIGIECGNLLTSEFSRIERLGALAYRLLAGTKRGLYRGMLGGPRL